MNYVQQKLRDDCGIAAMAMFMGVTYDDVLVMAQRVHPEYAFGDPTPLGLLLGVLAENDDLTVLSHWRDPDRPALLCVISPVAPLMGHAVYWDGERVWDPSPGPSLVTDEWIEKHCYGQIVRVRDLVEILGSRTRAALRQVLNARDARGEPWLAPGERRAA